MFMKGKMEPASSGYFNSKKIIQMQTQKENLFSIPSFYYIFLILAKRLHERCSITKKQWTLLFLVIKVVFIPKKTSKHKKNMKAHIEYFVIYALFLTFTAFSLNLFLLGVFTKKKKKL